MLVISFQLVYLALRARRMDQVARLRSLTEKRWRADYDVAASAAAVGAPARPPTGAGGAGRASGVCNCAAM